MSRIAQLFYLIKRLVQMTLRPILYETEKVLVLVIALVTPLLITIRA